MKTERKRIQGKRATELIEEAMHLLRRCPAAVLLLYCIGALPFAMGLLFFWSDMSHSGFAWQHETTASLGMVILFVWLKFWQAIFVTRLRAHFTSRPDAPWSFRRIALLLVVQVTLQPIGLFLLPVAAVLTLPFVWVYSYFQTLTALGDEPEGSPRQVAARSFELAKIWGTQNHVLVGILSVLLFFVALNWISAFVVIPHLLKSFLGIETAFSRGSAAYLNTTFFAVIGTLTWLTVDLLVKAAYMLRCFYASSIESGEDLRAELSQLGNGLKNAAMVVLACGVLFSGMNNSGAADKVEANAPMVKTIPTRDLEQAIAEVIGQQEYTWRIPREDAPKRDELEKDRSKSFLEAFMDDLGEWLKTAAKSVAQAIDRFFRWIDNLLGWRWRGPKPDNSPIVTDWFSPLRVLLMVLITALAAVLTIFIYRAWQRRQIRRHTPIMATAIPAVPDLRDENVSANDLPEDEWIRLARDLISQGELRLALRAYYLASLAHLATRNLITIAKFKSNRDYVMELTRRAHSLPTVVDGFQGNVLIFDRAWYGLHEVNREMVIEFARKVESFKTA
jgi:hypothetical protein